MDVLVLGGGIIGLTTAYYLNAAGHEVMVIDRNQGVAREASYANGGQLSYSYVAPLAGPGVLLKIPKWLMDSNSPMRFRPSLSLDQWRWCLQFLCNWCSDRWHRFLGRRSRGLQIRPGRV